MSIGLRWRKVNRTCPECGKFNACWTLVCLACGTRLFPRIKRWGEDQ